MGLLRTTVARQVEQAWRDGMSVERSPEDHQAQIVDRVLGALGELGVDEALVSGEHLVDFGVRGWAVLHPIACRPDMLACPIDDRIRAEVDGPPEQGPGRYRVWEDDEGDLAFEAAGRAR